MKEIYGLRSMMINHLHTKICIKKLVKNGDDILLSDMVAQLDRIETEMLENVPDTLMIEVKMILATDAYDQSRKELRFLLGLIFLFGALITAILILLLF